MTTASTKAYTGSAVPQGPIDIWLDVAVPGAAATVTLHTDGTPDATANPSAVHLGKLKDGAKISIKSKINEFYSDEATSPFRTILDVDEVEISGEWMQLQDTVLLNKMLAGSTQATDSATYEKVTGGGLTSAPATRAVLAVWTKPEDPTKFVAVVLYKAYASSGVEAQISKKNPASSPFTLKALSIDSRAVGDTVAQINIQV